MTTSRGILILCLLLTMGFTLGTALQPRTLAWTDRTHSGGVLQQMLGESRRMFAKDFYVKADVSFHSGYYPSIFDQARQVEVEENHMAAAASAEGESAAHEGEGHEGHEGRGSETQGGHEEEAGFLGAPTDWIDRFGRNFRITRHTHLTEGREREMLPWLQIAVELDPQRIEAYTVAAYWLRGTLGKVDEAEQFLRDGLKANPNSYEILFELGNLYDQNRHDARRARGVLQLAARRWEQRERDQKEPNYRALHQIANVLADLEEREGNYAETIRWLQVAKEHSPHPDAVQRRIDEARAKMSATPK